MKSTEVRAATAALLLQCCGRSDLSSVPDAAIGDVVSDATSEAHVTCDPFAPFTTIKTLDINTDFDDFDIRLTPDESVAYFVSNRQRDSGVGSDVFSAQRLSPTAPFQPAVLLPGLAHPNAGASDPNPTPSSSELVFTGACQFVLDYVPKLCGAHRNDSGAFGGAFTIQVGTQESDPARYAGSPYTIQSGSVAYFQATTLLNAAFGRSVRVDDTDYGAIQPVRIEGVTQSSPIFTTPVVTEDESVLFFALAQGADSLIWVAMRGGDGVFVSAHQLVELPSHSYPNWISEDACRLYLTHDVQTDGGSQQDVLVAER